MINFFDLIFGNRAKKEQGKPENAQLSIDQILSTPQSPTRTLQEALWKAGAFKGVKDRHGKDATYKSAVDGLMGRMTRTAIANAKKAGYNVNVNTGVVNITGPERPQIQEISYKGKGTGTKFGEKKPQKKGGLAAMREMTHAARTGGMSSIPIQSNNNLKSYKEILPEDKEKFAEWLYSQGSKSNLRNTYDVTSALLKNFVGLGNSIVPGTGTKQQALALHLYDNSDIKQNNDTLTHVLGYLDGTDNYKWQELNGKQQAHNNRGLYDRTAHYPGEFLLGRFIMKETPDKYFVDNETYNFNQSGTDYVDKRIKKGEATTYDKVRYIAGTYGSNKDIPVQLEIPKSKVLEWYNQFKNSNQ